MAEADASQVGLLAGFTIVGADASQLGLLAGFTMVGADASQVGLLVGWIPIIPNIERPPFQGQGLAGNSVQGNRFHRPPGFMGGTK